MSSTRAMQESSSGGRLAGADRVLALLVRLADFPQGARLDELARDLKAPKPSVHRALAALRRSKLVEQERVGRYRLTLDFVRMALDYYQSLDDRILVDPVLRTICEATNQTVHYGFLDGPEIVYLAKQEPPAGSIRMTSRVGGRNPAHSTGLGKALLSHTYLTMPDVDRYVADFGPLVRRTINTITSAPALFDDLAATRERGYAVDREENELGIICIAFPVFLASSQRPTGAVSVTAFRYQTSLKELMGYSEHVRSLIAARLGPTQQR